MSETETDFEFNFAPFKEYQPHEGEGSDVLSQDGYFGVKIVSAKAYITKGDANASEPHKRPKPAVKVRMVITDDDEHKGKFLISDVLCGGVDKNGEDLGRQFIDLLLSVGVPLENVHKNGAAGAKGGIKTLLESKVIEKAAQVDVRASEYQGKPQSKVENWVTKDTLDKNKAVGAHRVKRRSLSGGVASTGAGQTINIGGAASATPNGASGSTVLPSL